MLVESLRDGGGLRSAVLYDRRDQVCISQKEDVR